MITTTTADKALKNYYIDVLKNQLNTQSNPFYNKIENTSKYVSGKNIVKLAPYGLNGGFGFGTESGALPQTGSTNYENFVATTKDMYGVIQISDKAIKASKSDAGAFVDLLNQEMTGLLEAAKFNYSRALFTDGTGNLATCTTNSATSNTIAVSSVKYLIEGMIIDVLKSGGEEVAKARRIVSINRGLGTITVDGTAFAVPANSFITVQNSYNKELTGLDAIFKTTGTLYGVNRENNNWMIPYINATTGTISDSVIQTAIDTLEENSGSKVNYISCSYDVRRKYIAYLEDTRRNLNPVQLEGGFTAISYGGIPIVADRHCPDGTMDLLNTDDFALHYLSDWDWLDDDGKILKQVPGYPAWTAVLAKYGELICNHPAGQARLSGITG